MMEPDTVSNQLLSRVLPVQIGSYIVERLLSGNPSYADYDAHHVSLGHALLLRHERWPSDLSVRGNRSIDPADWTTQQPALEGLRRARRLQAEMQHPRILPVIDFFEHENEWFSVFARLPQAYSLAEIVTSIQGDHRPPLSIAEFVEVSAGITDGLAAIHRSGFVHRTLATYNVLVDGGGDVRLADLGCATPIGADDAAALAFRGFMRPASAAPEQFVTEGAFSPAIDNWALGVALFELRYGRHPCWTKIPATFEELRAAVLTGELTFPTATDEPSERLLQPWLRRLLERAPHNRYADALEAQRDLQAIAATIATQLPVARAFVAMPFAAAFDRMWRAIWSACAACRVSATRVDQSHQHENIWDEVCESINSSDFTIAVTASESSGVPNPNVMLEIGYARALHKPVLLLTDSPNTLPFDLRTQRALLYDATSIGGGAFHRELVSLVTGIIERRVKDQPGAASTDPAPSRERNR